MYVLPALLSTILAHGDIADRRTMGVATRTLELPIPSNPKLTPPSVVAEILALGGLGFILGDGGLNYGLEKIFETYYTPCPRWSTFLDPDSK